MKDVDNVSLVLDTSKLTRWAREQSARGMRTLKADVRQATPWQARDTNR